MGTIRGGISITTVDDGSTYNAYLYCAIGEPFQYYKEGSVLPTSDWTNATYQPKFRPIVIAGGIEVQDKIVDPVWHLDSATGVALEDDHGYNLDIEYGVPVLTIQNNILDTLKASRMLYLTGTVSIDGVSTPITCWIPIEYKDAAGDVTDLILTMTDNGVCKNASTGVAAVNGIVITATVKKGGAALEGYALKWFAFYAADVDGTDDDWQDFSNLPQGSPYTGVVIGPASASGSMPAITAKQVWVPKDCIASSEQIKCVATKSSSVETNYCRLYDLSDPYIIEFTTTDGRTNISSKHPALDITAVIKQAGTTINAASNYTWTIQGTSGDAITHGAATGTMGCTVQLTYTNTKGKGTIMIMAETSV